MQKFLMVTGAVALLLAAIWLFAPRPDQPVRMVDLPWQIEVFEDGTAKVLGVHLGVSTLADVMARYGKPEEIGLFINKDNEFALEAYYGTIHNGPLVARLVVSLIADQAELRALAGRAIDREGGPSGDFRLVLKGEDKDAQQGRVVSGLAYIPNYSKLDADFFRSRFGEPPAWERIDETSVRWYYPKRGLNILIDAEGKEVLQYVMPRDFAGPTEPVQPEQGEPGQDQ